MIFQYHARELTGGLISGKASSSSRAALQADLLARGQVLVSARVASQGGRFALPRLGGRVGIGHLVGFLRELRSLTGAGLPFVTALRMLEEGRDEPVLAAAIRQIRLKLGEGLSPDAAMALHPEIFDPLVCATVRAGIASGALAAALDHLIDFLELRRTLAQKFQRALAYPTFLLGLLVVVLAILLLVVLPRFSELYGDFGAELPWLTRGLLLMVDAAPVALPLGMGAVVCGWLLTRALLREPTIRLRLDRLQLGLPVIGPLVHHRYLAQVSFVISLALSAGLPLREAIRLAAASCANTDIAGRMRDLGEGVAAGGGLAATLARLALYPPMSLGLLRAGEMSGDLARMFADVATRHKETLEDRLARALALIEPAVMVLVGLVLGGVIIAVYLPIFGVSEVIQ